MDTRNNDLQTDLSDTAEMLEASTAARLAAQRGGA